MVLYLFAQMKEAMVKGIMLIQRRFLSFPDSLHHTFPVEERNQVWTRLKRHAAYSLGVLQVIDAGEMVARQDSIRQRPERSGDVRRTGVRAVRRQEEQGDIPDH